MLPLRIETGHCLGKLKYFVRMSIIDLLLIKSHFYTTSSLVGQCSLRIVQTFFILQLLVCKSLKSIYDFLQFTHRSLVATNKANLAHHYAFLNCNLHD